MTDDIYSVPSFSVYLVLIWRLVYFQVTEFVISKCIQNNKKKVITHLIKIFLPCLKLVPAGLLPHICCPSLNATEAKSNV